MIIAGVVILIIVVFWLLYECIENGIEHLFYKFKSITMLIIGVMLIGLGAVLFNFAWPFMITASIEQVIESPDNYSILGTEVKAITQDSTAKLKRYILNMKHASYKNSSWIVVDGDTTATFSSMNELSYYKDALIKYDTTLYFKSKAAEKQFRNPVYKKTYVLLLAIGVLLIIPPLYRKLIFLLAHKKRQLIVRSSSFKEYKDEYISEDPSMSNAYHHKFYVHESLSDLEEYDDNYYSYKALTKLKETPLKSKFNKLNF
jgi:hypothetical protein